MNKNFLIIGSKGFIGKHLVDYLKEKEYSVYGADVIIDYEDVDKYFLIDISNSDYHIIFQQEKFDYCINCSGAASVPDSMENPLRDYYLNTVNVYKILDAIKSYQPGCKFINLSSAAVYGNPESLPIMEGNKTNPVSPYGIHKLMSEQICLEFHQYFQIPTCSIRIFSAYGEGLKKQLFWDLFKKAKNSNSIELWGTGKESRDFIYIKDLISAIEKVALNADFKAECLNIGNGVEVTIAEAVDTFYGLFEKRIPFDFSGQVRKGDPVNWVADISRLKSLGYEQKYSLKEGLYNYYQWLIKQEKK